MNYIITFSLLSVFLILIRAFFKRRLHPAVTYALWLVLVIKLCIPVSFINVDFSVFKPTQDPDSFSYEIIDNAYLDEYASEDEIAITEGIYEESEIVNQQNGFENYPNDKVIAPEINTGITSNAVQKNDGERDWSAVLRFVWMIGAAFLGICFILSSIIFAYDVHCDRRLIGKYKGIKVYISEKARTPCLFGIVPSIYLTKSADMSEERELILLHEYTHLRHFDNLWSIVRMAVLVFLWWNPLVWAAALLSKQDGEIACDHAVTKSLDTSRKKEYANMLIDMIPKKLTLATGFANNSIKERIIMMTITKKQKNNMFITSLVVLLIIFAASCSFIGGERGSADKAIFPTYEKGSGYYIESIDFYKYDGENMYTATIDDESTIDNLTNELFSVKAVKSNGFNRGEKTVYGIRLNYTDYKKNNLDVYEYGFVDYHLITKDGTNYNFDYDLTKIEENHLEAALEVSELVPEFPCLWHIALDGDKWNEEYLIPTDIYTTSSNEYELNMLKFFGEELEFEYIDEYGLSNDLIFSGAYDFKVLLGTKWYILPYPPTYNPEIYMMKSYPMNDGVGSGPVDKKVVMTRDIGSFNIPLDTPTGYYRLTGGGYSHDIVINKDVRENIIDVDEIGGIERIDAQIREIIPELYYGEPFEGGYVYSDYSLLGLEREGKNIRATVAVCQRNYLSGEPFEFIGRSYPAIIVFKEENGKYTIESTKSPESSWTDVTKHMSEGIEINFNTALEEHEIKAFAGAIEYYNVDPNAAIKAIIDEAVLFYRDTKDFLNSGSFTTYGTKLRYYGDHALKYLFEEYVKGESEGDYDEVLKILFAYVTGYNKKSAETFSELFEITYALDGYDSNDIIVKYSYNLSRLSGIIPTDRYFDRYYINHPESVLAESKNILDTSDLEFLFKYDYEKGNTEYYFYITKTEPKRFKVGYKNGDGDLIANTVNIPSQFQYDSSEPLLMDYREGELFYVVKLHREDDTPIYLKFIIESNKFYLTPRPNPNFEQITEKDAQALLSEQKG